VHCAQGSALCATAKADRGNQTTPSPTAVPDVLPDEPGGYNGFTALYGHRYMARTPAGVLALRIKAELEGAAFGDHPVIGAQAQTTACQALIASAAALAKHL